MNDKLETLERKIFYGDHSTEEWKNIKKETSDALAAASREERQAFIDSGACNLLEQVLEYL